MKVLRRDLVPNGAGSVKVTAILINLCLFYMSVCVSCGFIELFIGLIDHNSNLDLSALKRSFIYITTTNWI